MTSETPATRKDLLALKPEVYLRNGFRSPEGLAWPEVQTVWPLAAAEQLGAKGVKPEQFDQSLSRVLPALLAKETKPSEAQGALLEVVNTPGVPAPVKKLFKTCAMSITAAADVPVAAQHLAAILRLLGLKRALGKH